MGNGYIDGAPEPMRESAGNFTAPIVGFFPPLISESLPACGDEFAECVKLTGANHSARDATQVMITHIMQGFEAYKSIILSAADCYEDAGNMSFSEFQNILNRREYNLPDKAQIFLQPAPANDA
ncbi:hypothetical protein GCM10027280_06970 [Micromonospora polyrhachis]|uniref:Uncharacterized protein n=1 Tax=Micromonospora polyrhachis TaxID=1282883 RepID=A0A7W7WM28_9ACTN|nr:hypothetical protein [Micromonospora polyrhachis]MBB4956390.1 hypothetical protein [Micromonospora polyrhachis]